MVSRIWKGDSAQEVRGRTVVPRGHVAPRAPKIGGGGGVCASRLRSLSPWRAFSA